MNFIGIADPRAAGQIGMLDATNVKQPACETYRMEMQNESWNYLPVFRSLSTF